MSRKAKIVVYTILFFLILYSAQSLRAAEITIPVGSGCRSCVITVDDVDEHLTLLGLYRLSSDELDTIEAGGLLATSGAETDYGKIILWDETGDEYRAEGATIVGDLLLR